MAQKTSTAMIMDYVRETNLGVGDRLPAEIDLARELQLSRNSIREAYARLSAQGVLVRRHGIGTFLARTLLVDDRNNKAAFWHMIEVSGSVPSLRELEREVVAAGEDVGALMNVKPDTRVTYMRWLFTADGLPAVLIDHYLAPQIRAEGRDLVRSHNLLAGLADQIGAESAELEVSHTAKILDDPEAGILGLEPGQAVLCGFARVHDSKGRIPIVSYHWTNPKLFSLSSREPVVPALLK